MARLVPTPKQCIPPFCDCEFPKCKTVATCNRGNVAQLVQCRCGEEDWHITEWGWHSNDADVSIQGRTLTFHPVYSNGTIIMRGNRPLEVGRVHYWEFRILTVLSGTDVMFGVGTEKVELDKYRNHFVSALGKDKEAWGLSYLGKKQHDNHMEAYGEKFSQGCIVGVQLDRSRGRLEYYLNRRSLGVAYNNIPLDPSVTLYPMVCSTSARCIVRLINATSEPDCLQLRAFKELSKVPKDLEELRQMPGFRTLMRSYWFLAPPVRYSRTSPENQLDITDEAVLSTKARDSSRKKKFEDDDCDVSDIYSKIFKSPDRCDLDESDSDDDDDLAVWELLDDVPY